MKQYLLIPIEEISDELNRLNNKTVYSHEQEVYENSFIKYLEELQSKGEIIEIEDIDNVEDLCFKEVKRLLNKV